jgi:hypothetical protein
MDAARTPIGAARGKGSDFARTPQFEWLARAGLVARGAIYAIVGVLAIQVAIGSGGKTTDQQGALATIAKQSSGEILLVLMAIGLAGYAIWRLLRAALGHGPEAIDDTKERIAGFASGIAYAVLCATTVSILIGSSSGGSGSPQKTSGGVLDWPGGQVLVIGAGLILLVVAAEQAYEGITRKFLEQSKTEQMSKGTEQAFTVLGVVGHLARTVVFGLIGYFLIKSAIDYRPKEAVGLDGALAALQKAAYGPVLLGVVAAGLIAFAAYSIADARYRKV